MMTWGPCCLEMMCFIKSGRKIKFFWRILGHCWIILAKLMICVFDKSVFEFIYFFIVTEKFFLSYFLFFFYQTNRCFQILQKSPEAKNYKFISFGIWKVLYQIPINIVSRWNSICLWNSLGTHNLIRTTYIWVYGIYSTIFCCIILLVENFSIIAGILKEEALKE